MLCSLIVALVGWLMVIRLFGLLVVTSGCALGTSARIGVGQDQYETGTGIYIVEKE